MRTTGLDTILDAATETNTPVAIPFDDVKRGTILITSAGTFTNRSGVLTATVSVDGTTYTAYNLIIPNVTNTNGQQLTRVAATTAIATTSQSALYIIDKLMPFRYIKFLLTVTDGATPAGSFTVKLLKQYR
ncbi:MAG: hypothetical protein NTW30_05595 [Candidatus Aenigmarchaeota archaeon]|nr:hypothetical protein [Candidatus Aenigmarchaeota archaeon]